MNLEHIKEATIETRGFSDDYGISVLHIIFPHGVTVKQQKEYLDSKWYPTKTINYHVSSEDGRDCTGQVHRTEVEYEGRLVTLTSYKDI